MTTVALVYPHIHGTDGYALDFQRLKMELECAGIDPVPINYSSSGSGAGRRLHLLRSLDGRLQSADVVHFIGFFFPEYLLAARATIARRVPYVISPLSNLQCYALERSRFKKWLFLSAGGSRFLRRANAIHSFGVSETESVLNLGFRGDVYEIPLGIDAVESDSRAADHGMRELGERMPGGDYILFFGRLDIFQKGLDVLLDGFESYCANYPRGLKLVIGGRSWNGSGDWLKSRIASMACSDRVAYLGETSNEAKFALMKNARALIYPSRFDGPPRPLRDAIASGVFVLASRQSNIYPDLEKHGLGFFFDANRVGIADAIKTVAGGIEAPAAGLGLSLLDWKVTAARYADMYRSMAAGRSRN
jgi:poly(glycerol-phosphate) alpha-glucosyltransferase